MKKRLIKVITFILVFSMLLTTTGCISRKHRKLAEQYEKEAMKIMKKYLSENYSGAKILDVEHRITSDGSIGGTRVTDFTEFVVLYKEDRYIFCYDRDSGIVYSNVNYDKILNQIRVYVMKKYNFNMEKLSTFSLKLNSRLHMSLYGEFSEQEVIRDSDKTFADFINTNNANDREYNIVINISYNNIDELLAKDHFSEDLFIKFANLEITVENFTDVGYYDKLYMSNLFNKGKVGISHRHEKTVIYDSIKFVYDDRYFDLQINKTDEYEENPERKYYLDKEFIPLNLAYDWKAVALKPIIYSNQNDYNIEYITDNGLEVSYSDYSCYLLSVDLLKEEIKNIYYKSVRDDVFRKGTDMIYHLNRKDKKNEDIISFYSEKIIDDSVTSE